MSEGALNSAAPFRFAFLSAFSVPRSEHPRPSDARSPFSKSAMRLRRCGLLPPGKLWSPSKDFVKSPWEWVATAHPSGKRVPQTADKPKETEPTHVQQSHPHRPPRTERRSQNRSEQTRVRRPQHRNPRKLEERQKRLRNPHRMAPRLCLEQSFEVRQDSPEGTARHSRRYLAVSRGRR